MRRSLPVLLATACALRSKTGDYADGSGGRAVERLRVRLAKLHSAPMTTFAWDDLRHFLAFARAGSMQAAATALGVNQSTVQRRIAELEECVGHHLVERHLGSYRMTELGEQLLPAAEAVEAAVAAFERHLAASERKGSHR